MELERRDANVYDLVTQLVQHIVRRNRLENDNSYMLPKSDIKTVKRLRSKAYEILLNKSNKIYKQGIFILLLTHILDSIQIINAIVCGHLLADLLAIWFF